MGLWRLSGIKLRIDEKEETLKEKAALFSGIAVDEILHYELLKKALDARRNRPPHYVCVVKIKVKDNVLLNNRSKENIQIQEIAEERQTAFPVLRAWTDNPVLVGGGGPAGLFAALVLLQNHIPVMLLERGRPILQRTRDVEKFWQEGLLNPVSNVLFGEGGAGTFSDGKLTCRTKNPSALWGRKMLVEMGAPANIITDAKPHIGTDRLRGTIINFREKLIAMGGSIRFGAQITDFIIEKNAIAGVVINGEEEIKTKYLILAIGQNSDDTYEKLHSRGVKMEAKPFALGLRVEHPQELINSIQYGRWKEQAALPPAEYFLTASAPHWHRSIYTFCMCPGGSVIGCSVFPGHVLVNGMSNSLRDGEFANSAVVVNIRTDDFVKGINPLAGLEFRRLWEKKAFLAGGGDYFAPAQRLPDFLDNKPPVSIGKTSFRPGVRPALMHDILPDYVSEALRFGLREFDKKMKGFLTRDAHLIGVETRTSAPLRICRGRDGQSETIRGIYPCGEGSGYAGGIVSSALDGIRAAENLLSSNS
ncbi:MAG TPA: hypothetical protein PKZ12_04865 [Smithellaceae bacterium]|nr:hypothetical protein [Smithellaceae bacterium]